MKLQLACQLLTSFCAARFLWAMGISGPEFGDLYYKALDCCFARKNGIVTIPSKIDMCFFVIKCIPNCRHNNLFVLKLS